MGGSADAADVRPPRRRPALAGAGVGRSAGGRPDAGVERDRARRGRHRCREAAARRLTPRHPPMGRRPHARCACQHVARAPERERGANRRAADRLPARGASLGPDTDRASRGPARFVQRLIRGHPARARRRHDRRRRRRVAQRVGARRALGPGPAGTDRARVREPDRKPPPFHVPDPQPPDCRREAARQACRRRPGVREPPGLPSGRRPPGRELERFGAPGAAGHQGLPAGAEPDGLAASRRRAAASCTHRKPDAARSRGHGRDHAGAGGDDFGRQRRASSRMAAGFSNASSPDAARRTCGA